MPKKPYADTRLAKFIQKRVMELRPRKSQAEISTEAGFVSLNMLSMLKSGASKLPLDRVPSLARALEEIMGTPVTRNELGWLQEIRAASDHSDPRMIARNRAALRAMFGK